MLKVDTTLETDPGHVPPANQLRQPFHDDAVPVSDPAAEVTNPKPPESVSVNDQFWPLDPQNIRVERIAGLIFAAVVMTGCMIGLIILWLSLGFGIIWFSVAGGAVLLTTLVFVLSYTWPSIEHRHASWRLDEEGLEIRRGVLWRHLITIPLGRVQHADVSQGPLQRPFQLGTLTIHTAGTQNASVELKGLAHSTAIELRDEIVRQRKDQHVV